MLITSFWDGLIIDDTQGEICHKDACEWPLWGCQQLSIDVVDYIYVGY